MTNHPNRSAYSKLIAKLQGISADGNIEAGARRLAVNIYQNMMAAGQMPSKGRPANHYVNTHGLKGMAAAAKAEDDRLATDRDEAMSSARARAESFLAEWNLA